MSEADYECGVRAVWLHLLTEAVANLGYNTPEANKAAWIIERERTIAALRDVCGDFGDNDWPDDLQLADVVDKHLGRYLHDAVENKSPEHQLGRLDVDRMLTMYFAKHRARISDEIDRDRFRREVPGVLRFVREGVSKEVMFEVRKVRKGTKRQLSQSVIYDLLTEEPLPEPLADAIISNCTSFH